MQVVHGNLELKDHLHFGRPNYIRFNHVENKYEFVIGGVGEVFEINTSGVVIPGDISISGDLTLENLTINDQIIANSIVIATTGQMAELSVTELNANNFNLTGNLIVNSISVSDNSIFHDDVTIEGGLNVLGSVTFSEGVLISVTEPLLHLAQSNPADLLDIGFFGEYNNGTTTVYSGLFRDANDSLLWKLFDGITEEPNPNFVNVEQQQFANIKVGNMQAQSGIISESYVTVGTNLTAPDIGTTILGVTGTANIDTLILGNSITAPNGSITSLTSNDIGVTSLGVTGTATINNLIGTTINIQDGAITNLSSKFIGVTTIGITGELNVEGNSTFAEINGTNIILSGDLNAADEIIGNSLSITSTGTFGSDLTVNANAIITGDLTVDGNTFYVESTDNQVGIGTTDPAYTLDVVGDIHASNKLSVSSIGVTSHIEFGLGIKPTHNEGTIFYDNTEHTLAVYNDESDVTHQLGQEGYIRVYNNSGGAINNGQVVYISGNEVVENRPTIALALANSESTSRVIGVATHSIEDNTFGYITNWGLVNDLNTSSFNAGDTLFLSATSPGDLSSTPATFGNYDVQVGFCIGIGTTNGKILTIIETSLSEEIKTTLFSTGLISGGILTTGVTSATFDISDGTGIIADVLGNVININWSGLSNQIIPNSDKVNYVSIGTTNNIIYEPSAATNAETRDRIFLGRVIRSNLVDVSFISNRQQTILHPVNQLNDLSRAVGNMNVSGNVISSNFLLTIQKTVGKLYVIGSNFLNSDKDPHNIVTAAIDTSGSGVFFYTYQNNTTSGSNSSIIPDEYDDGNGVSSPGTVPTDKYTIQRFMLFDNNDLFVLPGQFIYNSLADARANLSNPDFVFHEGVSENPVLIGYLIVRGGTTDLTIAADAEFINASKFSTPLGSISTTTLQTAYINTGNGGTPDITTDTTRNAVTIKRGTAADTDNVFEIQEGVSGINTFEVTGNGDIISSGDTTLNNLSVSFDATIRNDLTVLGDTNIAGSIIGGTLGITGDSVFVGDVEIKGGLNVLGAITSSESVSVATSAPLLELAVGNSADILDIGWYGQYVEGGVTKFAGLFRDVSDIGNNFKIFQGVTIKPNPNIDLKDDETNIANFQAFDIESLGDLHVHVDALVEGTLGATGDINTGGVYKIEGDTVLNANTLGSNIVNASLTTNDGNLGITGNVNLATTSHEFFIDNVRVLNYDTLGVGVTFSSIERLGTLNSLSVTGLSTFNDFVAMNENVGIDSLGVTFNTTMGGSLLTNLNIGTSSTYQIDGQNIFDDKNTLSSGVTSSNLQVLGLLNTLSITGNVNTTGGVYQIDGTEVLGPNTLGSGVTSSNLKSFSAGVNQQFGTGVLAGGILSVGVTSGTYTISNGLGVILESSNGTVEQVAWTGLTNVVASVSGQASFVSIDSSGTPIISSTEPTNSNKRDNIYIGILIHLDGSTITDVLNEQNTVVQSSNQLYDFMAAIGALNLSGNILSSNSGLTLAKSSGTVFAISSNYATDIDNPHVTSIAALDTNVTGSFTYVYQDGSTNLLETLIIPNEYDDGNGVSSPGSVSNNKWTAQRVYVFIDGQVRIQPGQTVYDSREIAISAISTESFVVEGINAAAGLLIGFIVVKGSSSDLTSESDVEFLTAGKFGESANVSNTTATNLQDAYDNTITEPDITTSILGGSLSIRRGSALDINNVFEIQNGSGTSTFLINGNGQVTATGDIGTSGVFKIDDTEVLNNTTLGSGILSSSLTSVGTLTSLDIVGDLTVDTNSLYVDSTNNFVGINTTSPAYELDVSGDLNVSGSITVDGLSIGGVTVTATWQETGANNLYNLNSANVGIGTTTPSFKLDVSGDINTSTTLRIDGIDIETVFNIIQVENKKTYFNEFLSLDGSIDMTANYTGVTEFTYTNSSSTETLFVSNLVVSIQDDAPFNLNEYGGIGTTLPNGMNIFYTTDSGATKNYIVGTTYNINKNGDYNNYTNDIVLTDLGTGDAIYTITLDFRNNGSFIILSQNEFFGIEVQDDMSLLNGHRAQINGFTYANSEL